MEIMRPNLKEVKDHKAKEGLGYGSSDNDGSCLWETWARSHQSILTACGFD